MLRFVFETALSLLLPVSKCCFRVGIYDSNSPICVAFLVARTMGHSTLYLGQATILHVEAK